MGGEKTLSSHIYLLTSQANDFSAQQKQMNCCTNTFGRCCEHEHLQIQRDDDDVNITLLLAWQKLMF